MWGEGERKWIKLNDIPLFTYERIRLISPSLSLSLSLSLSPVNSHPGLLFIFFVLPDEITNVIAFFEYCFKDTVSAWCGVTRDGGRVRGERWMHVRGGVKGTLSSSAAAAASIIVIVIMIIEKIYYLIKLI